jgi:UDP-N-acetyl-D-glucosamine dehydrogenase
MNELVVIGQGYVGLPMALRAAESGLSVVGLDSSSDVVKGLNSGHSHITDVSDDELKAGYDNGYNASTDPRCIADADAVLVCVPTPLSAGGGPDLGAVIEAASTIGKYVKTGALVVLESTTYPGTTEEIFAPLVLGEDRRVGLDVKIAFSPERIDPGNAIYRVRNTPKVVGGLTPACTQAATQFYSLFVDDVVSAKSAKEAEMSKLIENTFRHVNIALVNEMLRFSNELGIDVWNAIDCASTKPFGFMPFRPGPGVGGHCIPVDPSYLSHRVKAQLGYAFRMVELAEEINKAAPLYVVDRVWQALNDRGCAVRGSKVLLLGVTYKPNVADCRESPADPIARRLITLGAEVSYHDPFVPDWSIEHGGGYHAVKSVANLHEALTNADMVVLLQPHRDYDLAEIAEHSRWLLDTRGVLEPSRPSVSRL